MVTAIRRPHWLSRLNAAWAPPAVLDFWLSRLNPLWSWGDARARVVERRPEAEGVTTLVLKPNRHFRGFRAGQHMNIGVEIDGVRYTRSYSASDMPRADGCIRMTVKAVEGGKLGVHLQALAVGSVLQLGQAFGELCVPAGQAPCLMLAAGSGITPMLALVQAQAAAGFPRPVRLAYWARTRAELVQAATLRGLAARHPNFHVHFMLTGETAHAADESAGRIDSHHLATLLPEDGRIHVLACGSHGFVERARALLHSRCLSFQSEAFSPPPRVVDASDEGHVRVTLLQTGRTLDIARNKSLLEALEEQGIKPRHGCRMGICNTCSCGKPSGATRALHDRSVQHEPTQALRLCMHAAQSDLSLEL
ncbi:iron-sulfur cluster-binding domain-containing protein [Dyella sp. EPa41]|uniref:flavin reductase family protein n=1 Tax=Dyella sp. EPa41 TaxID=1561194 RepID=UPI00191543B2|nr:iron-sulfur cluster-binding domain-containing protein [Dyella sp. EPa41]